MKGAVATTHAQPVTTGGPEANAHRMSDSITAQGWAERRIRGPFEADGAYEQQRATVQYSGRGRGEAGCVLTACIPPDTSREPLP